MNLLRTARPYGAEHMNLLRTAQRKRSGTHVGLHNVLMPLLLGMTHAFPFTIIASY